MAGYDGPQSVGEEVKLIFELFDKDGSGKIDREELVEVFKTLGSSWSDDKMDKLMGSFDNNGDGELNMVEFWSWINGHAGSPVSCRKDLLATAIEKEKADWAENAEIMKEHRRNMAEKEAKDAAIAARQAERDSGARLTRDAFIKEKVAAGFSMEVATELYNKGDENHDGDIDAQELGWLAGDNLATLDQVKGIYRETVNGNNQEVKVAELDDSGMGTLVDIFLKWDTNGDGTVSPEELREILKKLNHKFTDASVDRMMNEIDTNKDGLVDVYEFVDWLTGQNLKKKKMKKKAKKVQDAKVNEALQERRKNQC